LDEYDGFFDQALDGVIPGDKLFFLLDEGRLSAPSKVGVPTACHEMRDRLNKSLMITGHIVEAGNSPFVLHIDKRETLWEVLQGKPFPTCNEALPELDRVRKIWQAVADSKRTMGHDYRFRFVCQLPCVSRIERAINDGSVCDPQMDFGSQPPTASKGFPLFLDALETSGGASWVRVLALGDNDIDSCRVFDVTSVAQYRDAICVSLDKAQSMEEATCWRHLLT
jgi:hypothetical protein